MTGARPEVLRFLAHRFPGSSVAHLTGDGSTRSFLRVTPVAGPSAIVMDYGRPVECPTDDERLTRVFQKAALPVAAILESHAEVGILIIQDVGDESLESALLADARCFAPERQPPRLLVQAVELAADVARLGSPVLAVSDRAAGPALDAERFRYEMRFFLEHFVSGHLGRSGIDSALADGLFELADEAADGGPKVLCHRDYHSRNLMVSGADLVMVDIQDARWGPDTYDLASILRDAYLPIPDDWVSPLIDKFIERSGTIRSRAELLERFHVVATQRMIKALGSFGYLGRIRGARYVASIAPTVARLRRSMPLHTQTARLLELLESADALPTDIEVREQ